MFDVEDARYTEVRAALGRRDTLTDHFAEHPWHHPTASPTSPGERRLMWYVSMPYPRTAAVLAGLQARLAGAAPLAPVAADEFHVTLQGVGRSTAVRPEAVAALREEARAALAEVAPFALILGGVNAFAEGPFVEVRGWRPLLAVRQLLRDAHRATIGGEPPGGDDVVPHLSLAYVHAAAPASPLAAAVDVDGAAPVGRLGVRSLELVCLAREGRHYRWTVEDSIPLGGTPGFLTS